MNPQQPLQDTGVNTPPEQPTVGGEPAVAPQPIQSSAAPQAQSVQVDSFSQSPVALPAQPMSDFNQTSQPVVQNSAVAPEPQPVVASTQPMGQPVITPPAGVAPSSPGIPSIQPPAAPVVGQGTVGVSGTTMSSNSAPNEPGKKQKFIKLGVIGGAVVVLLMAGLFGFMMWKNGQIALETYEGDGYTIQVPVGYEEKEEDDGSITFSEVTEDKDGQSLVNVAASKNPESATDEDIKQLKSFLTEENLTEAIETSDEVIFEDIANIKLDTVDTEDEFVVTGTADIKKDDKVTGKIYIELNVTDETVSTVVIRADGSDPGLDKQAQTIIDSLKFE